MSVTVGLVCGQGVDESSLQAALELEDPDIDVSLPFSASAVNALTQAWTGRQDEARAQMLAVRNRYIERGANSHIMFIDLHSTLIRHLAGRLRLGRTHDRGCDGACRAARW